MNKIIIVVILVLSVFSYSKGQSYASRNTFGYGFYISPSYSYRAISVEDEYIQWFVDERDKIEGKNMAYNWGGFVERKVGKSFIFSLGTQYSFYSFITDPIVFSLDEYPTLNKVSVSYNYYYLSMPFSMRYNLIKHDKWEFYANIGVSPSLFLNYNQKHLFLYNDNEIFSEKRVNSIDNNDFALGVLGGVGIDFHISEKLTMGFNPVFNRFLTSSIDSDIDEYLYSVGFGIKLTLHP